MYNNYANFAENNMNFMNAAQNAVKDYVHKVSENIFHSVNQCAHNTNEILQSTSKDDNTDLHNHGMEFAQNHMQLTSQLFTNHIQNNMSLVNDLNTEYKNLCSQNKRSNKK